MTTLQGLLWPGRPPVPHRIVPTRRRAQGLARQDAGLFKRERAVSADGRLPKRAAPPATGSIASNEGLAAGGLDPQAKAGQFGVPNDTPARSGLGRIHHPFGQLLTPPLL